MLRRDSEEGCPAVRRVQRGFYIIPVPYPPAHQVGPRMAVWLAGLLGHLPTVMTKLTSISEGNYCLKMHIIIIHAEHVVQSAWILFSLWMYVCMLAL